MITVAALYIDPRGPYPAIAKRGYVPGRAPLRSNLIVNLDCWDEPRDARLYDGPHPVVAHPPCGPWSRLRHLYRGNEHDCALRAVEQVRRWGGVLEHPAGSKLWGESFHGVPLAPPDDEISSTPTRDTFGGYTIEVDQVEWGHVARKRTWLYLVGVPLEALEAPPFPGRAPTHQVSRDAARARRNGYTLKRCSAQQSRRTPPLFAEYLVRLARAAAARRTA